MYFFFNSIEVSIEEDVEKQEIPCIAGADLWYSHGSKESDDS